MSRRLAPRLASFDYRGPYRYFLTICTSRRLRLFTSINCVLPVTTQIRRTGDACAFAIHAYCFMPDHVHALLEGMEPWSHLPTFVQRFKQISSYEWQRAHGAGLWQRGYYDHVLREEEDSFRVAAYIVANPVRAGICADALAYPFSGSETMTLNELAQSIAIAPRGRT